MASRAKYARRRRNAFLAAVGLALILIIIVVVIIVSLSKGNSTGGGSALNISPSPTNNILLPPPTGTDSDVTVNSPTDVPVTTPSAEPTDNVMYVSASALNVREKADASSKKLASLKKGDSVTIEDTDGDFYKVTVTVDGKTVEGYVAKQYVSATKSEATPTATAGATPDTSKSTVMYATADVRVRSSASTSGDNVVTNVKKGTKLTAYTTSSGWTYVEYSKGKFGYISAKYLTATAPTATPAATAGTATPSPTPAHATSLVDIVGQDAAGKIGEVPSAFLNITKPGQTVSATNVGKYDEVYAIKAIDGQKDYWIYFVDGKAQFTTDFLVLTKSE